MLKLSKDKTKLKRRIPFHIEAVDKNEMDKSMIYCERFPEEMTHDHLAQIFRKAGLIKHVSIPKFKHSKHSKCFAFI
jgi:RNA recognition motif-containing protein